MRQLQRNEGGSSSSSTTTTNNKHRIRFLYDELSVSFSVLFSSPSGEVVHKRFPLFHLQRPIVPLCIFSYVNGVPKLRSDSSNEFNVCTTESCAWFKLNRKRSKQKNNLQPVFAIVFIGQKDSFSVYNVHCVWNVLASSKRSVSTLESNKLSLIFTSSSNCLFRQFIIRTIRIRCDDNNSMAK